MDARQDRNTPAARPRTTGPWRAGATGLLVLALLRPLAATPAGPASPEVRAYGDRPTVASLTELGRHIFHDRSLSASGQQACASCHVPARGHAADSDTPVQAGGPAMDQPGTRAVPALAYLQLDLPFTEHYLDDEETHGEDAGPTGGLTWDGRVDRLRDQVRLPLFAANEMANGSAADFARRLAATPYAQAFREATRPPGGDTFDDPEAVVAWATVALEVYLQDPATFRPFTSKYDAFLRGQVRLDAAEARGLELFNDPARGNCASCHPSGRSSRGAFPLFTDSSHVALGLPRNRAIPANRDPAYFDLGLCGPVRTDLREHPEYCGRFKTPSLRNVALRRHFFHNGVASTLEQAVRFYAERDTAPQRWYPAGPDGRPDRFDDLPPALRGAVHQDAPFGGRPGDAPRLDSADVADLVAFLRTLTDGFDPRAAAGR